MRAALFLGLVLLPLRGWAVFDVYLEVTPQAAPELSGSVADPLYSGWAAVSGFECSAEREFVSFQIGERTAFRDFTLVKTVDAATPKFFRELTARTPIATVKMVVALRTPQRVELWDIQASTGLFLGQNFTASQGGEMQERITFTVRQFEWSYIVVGPAGDALTEIFANWSVLSNSGTTTAGTRTPAYPGGVDTDGDGIPDGWTGFYFGHLTGLPADKSRATDDADGDGLDNLREFIAHTNPLSPNSTLRITAVQKPGATTYGLTWQSVAGLTYRILSAPAPGGPYTHIQTVPSAGNVTTSTTIVAPGPPLFLRVAVP